MSPNVDATTFAPLAYPRDEVGEFGIIPVGGAVDIGNHIRYGLVVTERLPHGIGHLANGSARPCGFDRTLQQVTLAAASDVGHRSKDGIDLP